MATANSSRPIAGTVSIADELARSAASQHTSPIIASLVQTGWLRALFFFRGERRGGKMKYTEVSRLADYGIYLYGQLCWYALLQAEGREYAHKRRWMYSPAKYGSKVERNDNNFKCFLIEV